MGGVCMEVVLGQVGTHAGYVQLYKDVLRIDNNATQDHNVGDGGRGGVEGGLGGVEDGYGGVEDGYGGEGVQGQHEQLWVDAHKPKSAQEVRCIVLCMYYVCVYVCQSCAYKETHETYLLIDNNNTTTTIQQQEYIHNMT